MKSDSKKYTYAIKKVLLDNIEQAQKSIIIVMAWFTDNDLKDALIRKKKQVPDISIEIVVDSNHINKTYFLDYEEQFKAVGIIIKKKENRRFLHHKFMLIDGIISITGSYNYSKKAQLNLENIHWQKSKHAYRKLEKEYKFITTKKYEDENIQLLFSFPEFAQKLLSTYYKFSKTEYKKYKDKIILGQCYTYPTGFYDKIHYEPGIIFNTEINFEIEQQYGEFKAPISKTILSGSILSADQANIIDSYRGYESLYHEINGALKKNRKNREQTFQQKLDNTFSVEKLKELIHNDIDIIIEDYFWLNNFGPYINKEIVEKLFDTFPKVKRMESFEDLLDL